METINANSFTTNPVLKQEVQPTNDLKNILVEYVGEETNPEDKNVTVEMVSDIKNIDYSGILSNLINSFSFIKYAFC